MRVWVTRDEESAGPLASALRSAGLAAVVEPVVKRRVVSDAAEEMGRLGADDWLVLTSRFAIESVALDAARVPCVAVVGKSSERAARARGFRVELVSKGGTAKSLFEELKGLIEKGTVCYARSSLAEAPAGWGEVEMVSPVLYETTAREFDRGVIERIDVVSVVSRSAVRAIGVLEKPFASIGPSTTQALDAIGVSAWVEAAERSFESLAGAIAGRGDEQKD